MFSTIIIIECDKSFTRTDALQKHMRIQHGEIILPSTKRPGPSAPSTTTSTTTNSKRSKIRANSIDSNNDHEDQDEEQQSTSIQVTEGETNWTEEELEIFEQNPNLSKNFLAYVLVKAKFNYALGEHEDLAGELEALGVREGLLGGQCEELLRGILRKELS